MPQHAGSALGSFRHNPWDKPVEYIPLYKKRFTLQTLGARKSISPSSPRRQTKDAAKRSSHNWTTVRKAVNAARFWKRMAMTAEVSNDTGVDLGSLKQFCDRRKLKDVVWTARQEQENKAAEAQGQLETNPTRKLPTETASTAFTSRPQTGATKDSRVAGISSDTEEFSTPSRPQTTPAKKFGGSRRVVVRVGNALNAQRVTSPRNLQLATMLDGCANDDAWNLAWERSEGIWHGAEGHTTTPQAGRLALMQASAQRPGSKASGRAVTPRVQNWKVRTGASNEIGKPCLRPITAPVEASKPQAPPREKTAFTPAMFCGTATKPRIEGHPLLTAIEGMQNDETCQHGAYESGLLSQRLDEVRWGELRKGSWTNRPERRKANEKDVDPENHQDGRQGHGYTVEHPGKQVVSAAIARHAVHAGTKDIHSESLQMDRLIHIMDPDHTGVIAADVFVPLFFWLGLTRRRQAVLMTLELAFGSGDIEVGSIQKLAKYAEVQIRLIEGLRTLARRESLEQLCEYVTDMIRLRTWFHTMKRDTTGHADIVEVQNLFARMEVTTDRQTLFRFLTHIIQSEVLPSAAASVERGEKLGGATGTRTFGIGDFASLLCRCAVAWCVHRTLMLIDPNDGGWQAGIEGPMMTPAADLDREAEIRWVNLQRKIIVSLLVNHRFWGRESRTVLTTLNQPQMTTLGNQLSPEQWLSLFQRVRAQGIASTLPVGDEASDPEWLFKKVTNVSVSKPVHVEDDRPSHA